MSIEKLIQENTNALLALAEAIRGMGVQKSASPVCEGKCEDKPKVEEKEKNEKPAPSPAAETKAAPSVTATESHSDPAKAKEEANNGFPVKTYDDCAELVKKLAATKGRDPIVSVLAGFGVTGLSQIDKAHFGAVWAQLKAELDK